MTEFECDLCGYCFNTTDSLEVDPEEDLIIVCDECAEKINKSLQGKEANIDK